MRKVVIELSIQMVVDVRDDSTEEEIDFYFNESSHCADNEIGQLADELKKAETLEGEDSYCFCHRTRMKYLREATKSDLEELTVKSMEQIAV